MKKVKITLDGMHCASCANNVEKAIRKVDGIANVSVSLMTKKAIIEADDKVSNEELKKAIEKTGYRAVKFE